MTWLLIAAAWLVAAVLVALVFAVLVRGDRVAEEEAERDAAMLAEARDEHGAPPRAERST